MRLIISALASIALAVSVLSGSANAANIALSATVTSCGSVTITASQIPPYVGSQVQLVNNALSPNEQTTLATVTNGTASAVFATTVGWHQTQVRTSTGGYLASTPATAWYNGC